LIAKDFHRVGFSEPEISGSSLGREGLILAGMALLLGCAVPMLLLSGLPNPQYDWSALVAVAVTFYSAVRLALYSGRGEQRLLKLTFWVFVYVFMGLTPLLQIAARTFPYAIFYFRPQTLTAELIVALGLFSYEMGYARAFRSDGSLVRKFGAALSGYQVSQQRLLLLTGVALVLSVALVMLNGGIAAVLEPREQMVADLHESVGGEGMAKLEVIRNLMQVSPVVSAFIWWSWIVKRRRQGIVIGSKIYLVFIVVLCIATLTCNPFNGSRYLFASFAVSALMVTIRDKRWFSPTAVLVLVASLMWLYPAVGSLREADQGSMLPDLGVSAVDEQLTNGYDFDGFRSIIDGVSYVEHDGLAWGRQLLGTMTFWVPREYWDNKPRATGEIVSINVGYLFTNISSPLWEEAYVDWGMAGVIVMFFLYGRGSAILDDWHQERSEDVNFGGVLVTFLAGYQFYTLRGSLWAAVAYLIPIVVLSVVVCKREGWFKVADETRIDQTLSNFTIRHQTVVYPR
jgi:hypothetical protein